VTPIWGSHLPSCSSLLIGRITEAIPNDTTIKRYITIASRLGDEGVHWTYEGWMAAAQFSRLIPSEPLYLATQGYVSRREAS
jgi:hypothetical protein